MTKIRELSEDLVEEILCRVPVTSVKKVRSSCKGWNRLFKEKRFVRKHSVKAAKQFMCLMLTKRFRICPMRVNLDGSPPSVEVKDELSLLDPRSCDNSALEFDVDQAFHCDGLLLCTSEELKPRIVVWNPFTSQTRWIDPVSPGNYGRSYALGYCYHQDKKSSFTRSYKVLSFCNLIESRDSEIYDFDTDSWRVLNDGGGRDPARRGVGRSTDQMVSFKGNTYWFVSEREKVEPKLGVFLLRFDFSTEKFGRVPLPYQCRYETACFSVVREEKLSVLLEPVKSSKTEIWVTSKIGESDDTNNNKWVSWTKVLSLNLSLDLQISDTTSFFLDEEKKVVVCCDRWLPDNYETYTKDMVYIVGEDSHVTQQEFGVDEFEGCWPLILNYFPTLVQIQRAAGKKRKRLDMMKLIREKPNFEAITIIKDRLEMIDKDVKVIRGLAESTPFALSLLEDAKSELQSLLDDQLGISNRNNLQALLERYM